MQITAALILGCSALQLLFFFANAAAWPPFSDENVETDSAIIPPPWNEEANTQFYLPRWNEEANTQFYGCCSPKIDDSISFIEAVGREAYVNIFVDGSHRRYREGRTCSVKDDAFTYVYSHN